MHTYILRVPQRLAHICRRDIHCACRLQTAPSQAEASIPMPVETHPPFFNADPLLKKTGGWGLGLELGLGLLGAFEMHLRLEWF